MRILALTAAIAIASSAAAVPPPPPPAFIMDLARELVATPTAANFDDYSHLFADDLTVTINGTGIASTKAGWLVIERGRLGKVDRFVYGLTEGRDSVLIVDRFDDKSDEHCPVPDSCVLDPRYVTRAVRYQIGPDHLVHSIRVVETENPLHTP